MKYDFAKAKGRSACSKLLTLEQKISIPASKAVLREAAFV
jgi:hypothetical protein